jgi:hypothetical protein
MEKRHGFEAGSAQVKQFRERSAAEVGFDGYQGGRLMAIAEKLRPELTADALGEIRARVGERIADMLLEIVKLPEEYPAFYKQFYERFYQGGSANVRTFDGEPVSQAGITSDTSGTGNNVLEKQEK